MTNGEKLAKELLKDPEMFARVIENGLCNSIANCACCFLRGVMCVGSDNIREWLECEVIENG